MSYVLQLINWLAHQLLRSDRVREPSALRAEEWEEVIDFTTIQKDGVEIFEVLNRL